MEIEKEVAFFDRHVEDRGEYDVLGERAYRRFLSRFERWVRPRPGETCVDLGCGTGAFTRRLRPFGLELSGLDISPRSIDRARALAAAERYETADIRSTGLPGESVDIAVYSGVLHHADRDTRLQILREGHRILKRGGRLFAYDPSAHSPSMWLYRSPRSPLYSSQGKTDNEVLLKRSEMEEELRASGFGGIRVRGIAGITFRYVEGRVARRLLPLYNLYERALAVSPLESRLGTFLVSFALKPGPP